MAGGVPPPDPPAISFRSLFLPKKNGATLAPCQNPPYLCAMTNNKGRILFQIRDKMSSQNKRELWGKILNVIISVISAVLTSLGMQSCI